MSLNDSRVSSTHSYGSAFKFLDHGGSMWRDLDHDEIDFAPHHCHELHDVITSLFSTPRISQAESGDPQMIYPADHFLSIQSTYIVRAAASLVRPFTCAG